MLLATFTLLVAGVTISECFSCDGPGVVPAPHPNKFVFCTYNEDGDLVARLLPCSDGATLTGNDKWEMVSKQDCVVRRRREAVNDSEPLEKENKTESVLKELRTDPTLQPEVEISTEMGTTESSAVETEAQTDEPSTETQALGTDDQTEKEAATTHEAEKPSDSPTTHEAEKPSDSPTTREAEKPSDSPTTREAEKPSDSPTTREAEKPSDSPTTREAEEPSDSPTTQEAEEPSDSPTTESASTKPPSDSTTTMPNSNETKSVECWYPGVTCASCSQAAFCVGTGTLKNGQPLVIPVTTITCGPGEVCVEMIGCVSDKNRFCTKGEFSCTDQGIFPDPYDCRFFHSCVFLNGAFFHEKVQCLAGAYNSKTGTCGYPLNTATCLNKPVPHCKQEFEVGAVPSNPNLYYVCVKKGKALLPSLFRCPGGKKFTTALFRCV